MFQRSLLFAGVACTVMLISFAAIRVAPEDKLGSVIGMSGVVEGNPYNTIADQLKKKELALAEREQSVALKEGRVNEQRTEDVARQNKLITIIIIGGIGIVILILLNFYLDYRRAFKAKPTDTTS